MGAAHITEEVLDQDLPESSVWEQCSRITAGLKSRIRVTKTADVPIQF
jgi:hypothetical protein